MAVGAALTVEPLNVSDARTITSRTAITVGMNRRVFDIAIQQGHHSITDRISYIYTVSTSSPGFPPKSISLPRKQRNRGDSTESRCLTTSFKELIVG
jgi:hypothetical protein